MSETFLHGVSVLVIDDGARPLEIANQSVIGIVGTAPNATAEAWPLNTPILVTGGRVIGLGATGTLPAALNLIHAQGIAPAIVVVRVADIQDDPQTTDVNERLAAVIGSTDPTPTGMQAFRIARSALGVTPRILIAPGFSNQTLVAQALISLATYLRGIAIIDGPNTTSAAAQSFRQSFSSQRAYLVDPSVKVGGATVPASAAVAGIIARVDTQRGFWWSPSNHEVLGITGLSRDIEFTLGVAESEANILNENRVATIIRHDGYRLWGNRTCAQDLKWVFLPVVRTADAITDAMLRGHMWAVDRPITRATVRDITETVMAALRDLRAKGAILGGTCWPNAELNTPTNLAAGKVYFDFDFTPPAPAERITFRAQLVDRYAPEALRF